MSLLSGNTCYDEEAHRVFLNKKIFLSKLWLVLLGVFSFSLIVLQGTTVFHHSNQDDDVSKKIHLSMAVKETRKSFASNLEYDYRPVGSEYRVNTYTTNKQTEARGVQLDNGMTVIVWMSFEQITGSGWDIYLRKYYPNGDVSTPQLVNTITTSYQAFPEIAKLTNGGFVITWTSYSLNGQPYDNAAGSTYVYYQRFDLNGDKVGSSSETLVNSNVGEVPHVAAMSGGGFVISWFRITSNVFEVYAQRFDSNGNTSGSAFKVNTKNFGSKPCICGPSVTVSPFNNNFVIAWQSDTNDGSSYGIAAQRFDSNGNPLGTEILVNLQQQNEQSKPAISFLKNGGFIIVWVSLDTEGGPRVIGKIFDANGNILVHDFTIATYSTSYSHEGLAVLSFTYGTGEIIVAWTGDDGNGLGCFFRRYDTSGTSLGPIYKMNTYIADTQYVNHIVQTRNNNFLALWTSMGQDGDDWGVYSRQYSLNTRPWNVVNQLESKAKQSVIVSNLNMLSVDSENDTITYTVSNLQHGYFEMVTAPGISITSFTQHHINASQVRFVSTSLSAPSFHFYIRDGVGEGDLYTDPQPAVIDFKVTCFGNYGSNACGGPSKGTCVDNNVCQCTANYGGSNCVIPKCNGILQGAANVCNGHGSCDDVDLCRCDTNWGGQYCQVPKCNGVLQNMTALVCNGHGSCDNVNTCSCNSNYGGQYCDMPKCNGYIQGSLSVCNGHGSCDGVDICRCDTNWGGKYCELPKCNGIPQNVTSLVCNGRGLCTDVDTCTCNAGYSGQFCDKSIPVIINNKILVSQGQTTTVTSNDLLATDSSASDAQIYFTISNLRYGRFEVHSPAVSVVTNFSQLQVKEGIVKFVHTGTAEQTPSYQISVSNGFAQTASVPSTIIYNRSPYVKSKMLDQSVQVDKEFSIPVGKDIFTDPDGESLVYKAALETGQALPSWVKFDEMNYILKGKASEQSTNKFKFYVVDKGNMEAESVFEFKVVPNSGLGVVDLVAIIVPIAGLIVSVIALLAGGGGIWGCVKYFKKQKSLTTGGSTTELQPTTSLPTTPSIGGGTSSVPQSPQSTPSNAGSTGAPKP
ncbi:hypothetical protein C9374_013784 [Naegleria lovaniensis]|uniref:EGF-like domain-containing protein n=1 Tax=Naegleria lovaniensis TaxID=51637 RepID=A0AA88KH73_NAELO|nr:uncharacterized protein C9374_013784 [Naegleria lovaniensis]KAG2370873.1 hypothetical protein C9374_013784 [Naegleria lovaniensis]